MGPEPRPEIEARREAGAGARLRQAPGLRKWAGDGTGQRGGMPFAGGPLILWSSDVPLARDPTSPKKRKTNFVPQHMYLKVIATFHL